MIERAAACLKNGGNHLLRTPKWNLRTHRSLHSAFWSHGAGDIDLPAWWLALLQVPSACDLTCSSQDNATPASRPPPDGLDLGLLDFLYPEKTLAFIRKCVRGNSATVRRRHRPSQLLLQRSRAYTSAADGSGSVPLDQAKEEQELCTDVTAETKVVNDGLVIPDESECKAKLHGLLYAKEHASDGRAIWQEYRQLMNTSLRLDPGDLIRLFERFSTSKESLEIFESTINLFNDIPESRRSAPHYKYAIKAALKLQQLESAMDMHREAVSRCQGDFGSSIIFEYVIHIRDWNRAEEIWKVYGDHRQLYCTAPDLLWERVDTMTVSWQMERAISAVKNTIQRIEITGHDDARPMSSLAVSLVQRALNARRTGFKGTLQLRMLNLMRHIQQPDLILYRAAVLQNLSLGVQSHEHNEMAVKLYRQIRGELNIIPDLGLLKAMTKRFTTLRDSQGMHEVLQDYQRYHETLPPKLCSVLMAQLARHGDYDTVEALFQQYVTEFGKVDVQNHANLLLWACFRRAEANRAESVLQSLKEKYGYVPGLKAWNIVLATYVRVRDRDGAMTLFEKLVGSDIPPDKSSYGILMGMFAKEGDFEAAGGLYERATSAGIKPSPEMVNSLVVALVNGDRFDEAYQMVEKAQTMNFDEERTRSGPLSLTRMWNTLLTHCASKSQLHKVTQIQQRMQEFGVPFDSHTYSALMLALCIKKLPHAALKIMEDVMPRSGARVTALHYDIVMGGFLQTKEPEKILPLANEMLEKGIRPTFSTQNHLLRLASRVDEKDHHQEDHHQEENLQEENLGERPFHAGRAEQVLERALEALNPMELAPTGPKPRAQPNPPNVAFYASYFPYMIYLYGKKKSFEGVVRMYDKYVSTAQKVHGVAEVDPPVELLSALMVAHTNAGEHLDTEKCWHLAMEKSGKIACMMNADTSQPGWVLHKYRFLLALPLTRYMQSLHATSRLDDIVTTVDYLQHAGYQLSVYNWNEYVQILAKERRSMAAFETCERQLMDDWPGWPSLVRGRRHKRAKKNLRKQLRPPKWEMGKQVPQYETLVHLAGVYNHLRRLPYGTGKGPVMELQKVAPRALEAVLRMPKLNDDIQPGVLRARR
ncbi:MAG: hypothetical protein Q9223_007263 [Gallowayella weberi]